MPSSPPATNWPTTTWSHRRLASIPADEAIEEIDRRQESVSHFTPGVLIRAPYGEVKAETLLAIQSDGLIPVHWSVPLDHYVEELGLAPLDAARAIARDTMPGDIILAHDAHDGGIDRDHTIDTVRYLLPAHTRLLGRVSEYAPERRHPSVGAGSAVVLAEWVRVSRFLIPG
jgi:peptidoglycan/xylan/chitin deacetylase (PgdA/CDA1 family)